ncbi:hypothetical protein GQX73_g8872 [Xylaria multiplex]|uniref:Acyl-CoA oxidase C-alpha1 domain-containing protein n=1 Tax=Xylaria multiplex TaxID=323545 RepID=A0A7C8MP24_9PEZI|nr:hypothetical protein GQX73_g8872 [Xylaria multiplex]
MDHSITTFTHVRLSPESLLRPSARAHDEPADFFRQIHRAPVGTLSLPMTNIPALQQSALIAGTYNSRRHVADSSGTKEIPIIQFPKQYRPILNAIVQSWVYDAFADEAIALFLDAELDTEVRHAVEVCFKTAIGTDTQNTINELAERCGWRGILDYNEIIQLDLALGGNEVAEEDYTVLYIRLVSEVLLGRYELPKARMKTCQLPRHQTGIWQEAQEMVESLADQNHHSEKVNANLLPRCRDMVKATGNRMAYETAVTSGKLKSEALQLFELTCIKSDSGWYCQFEGFGRNEFLQKMQEPREELIHCSHSFYARIGIQEIR